MLAVVTQPLLTVILPLMTALSCTVVIKPITADRHLLQLGGLTVKSMLEAVFITNTFTI